MINDIDEINVVIQDTDSVEVTEGTPTDIAEIMHNEEIRIANENERIANETQRINNEEDREEYITELKQRVLNGEFNGEDGFSPIANVSKSGSTATITITDKNGTTTASVNDGTDGQDGEDGYSPTATVTKSGKIATITITDENGTTTCEIRDGEDGQGSGDMLKSTYDTNNNGIVDNAEKVNNHTVLTDVPANAVFTDTTAEWGNITGTLSNQTDLMTVLNSKSEFIPKFEYIYDKGGESNNPLILDELDPGLYIYNPISYEDRIYVKITSSGTAINSPLVAVPCLLYIPKKIEVSDLTDGDVMAIFTHYKSVHSSQPMYSYHTATYSSSTTGNMYINHDYLEIDAQRKITVYDKLSADLVEDYNCTNKFVTASEKTTWNNKSDFSGSYTDLTNKPNIPSKTSDLNNDSGFIDNTVNNLTNYTLSSSLSTVATSGSYSDLSNKPTIPDELADLTDDSTHRVVTDTEKTTWSGKQDAINSNNKLSADLVSDSTSTNKFVTASEKTTWSGKQDALVSGTNIKTINNTSLLGSGNISLNVATTQVYSADTRLYTSVADTNNIITVNAVQGTVLMYFITYSQPLENWDGGALVEIGSMFHDTNKLWLKTDKEQNYRIRISALYIPN